MQGSLQRFVLLLLIVPCSLLPKEGAGQVGTIRTALVYGPAEAEEPLDERLLYAIYGVGNPVFRSTMRAVDVSSYPAFVLVPVAAWAYAALGDGSYEAAYRLTLSEGLAFVGATALKRVYKRPRPYTVLPRIEPRAGPIDAQVLSHDSLALPSGHATLAFAIATSWSLSYSEWYVMAPSLLWASAVALSRVWLGVHYPSDVLAGALLGTSVGVGIHLLAPYITPGFGEDNEPPPALLALRIRL